MTSPHAPLPGRMTGDMSGDMADDMADDMVSDLPHDVAGHAGWSAGWSAAGPAAELPGRSTGRSTGRTWRDRAGAARRDLVDGSGREWGLRGLRVVAVLAVLSLLTFAAGAVFLFTRHTTPGTFGTAGGTSGIAGATGASADGQGAQPAATTTAAADVGTADAARAAQAAQDSIAQRSMPDPGPSAGYPGPLVVATVDPVALPASTRTGAVGVASGYPRTSWGAVAQLAAIDEALFSQASVSHARKIIAAWAVPGGPTQVSWSGVRAMTSVLSAAGLTSEATGQDTMVFHATTGLVKGAVGTGWVLACVNGELDVTIAQTSRGAIADCQRMTWDPTVDGGTWRIAAGAEPVQPNGAWPGTQAAYDAGWKDLTR